MIQIILQKQLLDKTGSVHLKITAVSMHVRNFSSIYWGDVVGLTFTEHMQIKLEGEHIRGFVFKNDKKRK